MGDETEKRWVDLLSEEDLAFIKRFVLASGSLKELAQAYGITYPTIRLRLDRLIEKVKILDAQDHRSDFDRLLRACYVEGKIEAGAMKALLAAYRKEKKGQPQ